MSGHILLCEDDEFSLAMMGSAVRDAGFSVTATRSVDECIAAAGGKRHDLAVIDVMMDPGSLGHRETKHGYETGIALARTLKTIQPDLKLLGMSQSVSPAVSRWFRRFADGFIVKSDLAQHPHLIGRWVMKVLTPTEWWNTMQTMIVHGHDHDTRRSLERYLTETLRLRPPIVLAHRASVGHTLIEKLEQVQEEVDVVFVLMTPDDSVVSASGTPGQQARPNVHWEGGFFFGAMRRRSGRVILLTKGPVVIPSDLLGLGFIDVTKGIEAADMEIRRELEALSQS